MKIIETEVYSFDELSPAAREKARAWYRRINDGDARWCESIVEEAREFLSLLGFSNTEIYWRGFASQGDGACFIGTWHATGIEVESLEKWLEDRPQDTDGYVAVQRFTKFAADNPDGYSKLIHVGHYYHENSVQYDEENLSDPDGFREACQDIMRSIYRDLEREYEFQNSDEVVDDAIRVNEYWFLATGERFKHE